MLYNKDKECTLKYIDINGQQQELKYTPEKDMSVPEIITMLKNKDKDFFKLLKESKFDKVSKKIFNKGKQDGMTKDDADAIAASIGRKKYGKEKFQKMAQKGKKTEADNTSGTLSIDLNTGVLPIVDVDMYSMSDMINDFDVTQKELDDIVMETAPEYIEDTLSEILSGVSVIAKSVYHPSQYNYSGDELEFTLNCDKGGYESLKERTLQNESFSKFLKDNYSSHSGFISSMADNLDDFETQEEWKQVVQVIMFNVPQKTLEYNKDAYNDKFMDILSSNYPMIDDEDYDDYVNEDLEESKQVKTESIEFNASTFDELEEEVTEMYENDKIDDDMYETILDLIDVERSNTEEYINNRRKVTNTDYKDEIGIEEDNVEALKKAIKEKLPELTTESKLVEDEEDNNIEDIETKETVEPEDTTELQQEIEEVVTELDNVTEEETLGLEVTVGTIDVLIKDEEAAIDGYNSFLNQIKDTIPETVYNTIEEQLKEVIQDEEDHINILNTIKENLNTTEAPIEENKEIVLTENVTVEDIFNELDIDIDSPAAEYEWNTVQEYLDSNPDITLEQAVKDIEEYFETGLL